MTRLRYVIHPDDEKLLNKTGSYEEYESIYVYLDEDEGIAQIHNVLTIPLKQTACVRYIVHPEDQDTAEFSKAWNDRYSELRVVLDEDEGKTVITQVNNKGTALQNIGDIVRIGSTPGTIKHAEIKVIKN